MEIKKHLALAQAFTSKLPPYLIFFVTARCNSRCRMCFYWQNIDKFQKEKELTLDEIKKISQGFGGLQYLSISGGESFLRDDLPEIVQTFVKQNKAQFVSLPTNGILSERIVTLFEEMLKNCPQTSFRIALSIDGTEKDHDAIRGVVGNFEKVKITYQLLNKLREKYDNFDVDVTTVYSSFNQGKIESIYNWVEENMNIDNHVLLLARGSTREKIAKDVSPADYEKAVKFVEERAVRKIARRKDLRLKLLRAVKLLMREVLVKTAKEQRMILPCVAGKRTVVINEVGDVYPCELLNMKMGNLRENGYSIQKTLFSPTGEKVKKFIKDSKCFCTFECVIQNNIIYNPRTYLAIFKKLLKIQD